MACAGRPGALTIVLASTGVDIYTSLRSATGTEKTGPVLRDTCLAQSAANIYFIASLPHRAHVLCCEWSSEIPARLSYRPEPSPEGKSVPRDAQVHKR